VTLRSYGGNTILTTPDEALLSQARARRSKLQVAVTCAFCVIINYVIIAHLIEKAYPCDTTSESVRTSVTLLVVTCKVQLHVHGKVDVVRNKPAVVHSTCIICDFIYIWYRVSRPTRFVAGGLVNLDYAWTFPFQTYLVHPMWRT